MDESENEMMHHEFLRLIQNYVEANPDVAGHISDYVTQGLIESRKQLQERACDMEVALSAALAYRYKSWDSVVLDKLRKWNGKSSLVWSETIKRLEKK